MLLVGDTVLFESAVICDFLDETLPPRLHPEDLLERARHRAWIEYGSAILNDIARFYSADSESTSSGGRSFAASSMASSGIWAPVPISPGRASISSTRSTARSTACRHLRGDRIARFCRRSARAQRLAPGAGGAAFGQGRVAADYADRLRDFLAARRSHLSTLMARPNQDESRALAPPDIGPILRAPSRRGSSLMAAAALDVVGIGNAIVDVIAQADDAFLAREGLAKGSMQLIDAATRRGALCGDGPGDRDVRRLGREYHGRDRVARRHGRLYRQGAQRRARPRLRPRHARRRRSLRYAGAGAGTADRSLPHPGDARRAAHHEHLSRRLRRVRAGGSSAKRSSPRHK